MSPPLAVSYIGGSPNNGQTSEIPTLNGVFRAGPWIPPDFFSSRSLAHLSFVVWLSPPHTALEMALRQEFPFASTVLMVGGSLVTIWQPWNTETHSFGSPEGIVDIAGRLLMAGLAASPRLHYCLQTSYLGQMLQQQYERIANRLGRDFEFALRGSLEELKRKQETQSDPISFKGWCFNKVANVGLNQITDLANRAIEPATGSFGYGVRRVFLAGVSAGFFQFSPYHGLVAAGDFATVFIDDLNQPYSVYFILNVLCNLLRVCAFSLAFEPTLAISLYVFATILSSGFRYLAFGYHHSQEQKGNEVRTVLEVLNGHIPTATNITSANSALVTISSWVSRVHSFFISGIKYSVDLLLAWSLLAASLILFFSVYKRRIRSERNPER